MNKVTEYLKQMKDVVENTSGADLLKMVKEANNKAENEMFEEYWKELVGQNVNCSSIKQAYLRGCLDTRTRYANSDQLSNMLNKTTNSQKIIDVQHLFPDRFDRTGYKYDLSTDEPTAVFFFFREDQPGPYFVKGWYFADECWQLTGPYNSHEEAVIALDEYVKEFL